MFYCSCMRIQESKQKSNSALSACLRTGVKRTEVTSLACEWQKFNISIVSCNILNDSTILLFLQLPSLSLTKVQEYWDHGKGFNKLSHNWVIKLGSCESVMYITWFLGGEFKCLNFGLCVTDNFSISSKVLGYIPRCVSSEI
jgi:hypothetical protein